MSEELKTTLNTDVEIWRENKDDYYSPSIHITAQDGIGINVGGYVAVMPVRVWHKLARQTQPRPLRELIAQGHKQFWVKDVNEKWLFTWLDKDTEIFYMMRNTNTSEVFDDKHSEMPAIPILAPDVEVG